MAHNISHYFYCFLIINFVYYLYLIDTLKAVDELYNYLPEHLHDKYAAHVKEKLFQAKMVEICPITGNAIFICIPITIHAIKN